MLGPRKRPTSCHARRDQPPAPGSPTRTYSSQSGRQIPRGTPNSSIAIVPPGRTTRASSRSVAARVVDVAQEVGERERVELRVVEGQRLGVPLAELDRLAEPAASLHGRAAGSSIPALWPKPIDPG